MVQLLVSVRGPEEAVAALEGGADLIDVKEPAHGPLGRADDVTIAAVVRAVSGRRPVSAALGELLHQPYPYSGSGLAYVKWGLAGQHGKGTATSWQDNLERAAQGVARCPSGPRVVLVAYADAERAGAPPLKEVCAWAQARPGSVLLLDTFHKEPGRTLLDCVPLSDLLVLCRQCRAARVRVALAGSLGLEQVRTLLPARPDWFAVRGAVCQGGDRRAAVCADRVRALAELVTAADS